jgi:hypothetical protein
MGRQQEFATSRGGAGPLCQDGRGDAHRDHRDETMENLPTHP